MPKELLRETKANILEIKDETTSLFDFKIPVQHFNKKNEWTQEVLSQEEFIDSWNLHSERKMYSVMAGMASSFINQLILAKQSHGNLNDKMMLLIGHLEFIFKETTGLFTQEALQKLKSFQKKKEEKPEIPEGQGGG